MSLDGIRLGSSAALLLAAGLALSGGACGTPSGPSPDPDAAVGTVEEPRGDAPDSSPAGPVVRPAVLPDLPAELQGFDEPRFGDLGAMIERRVIRVLTVYRLGGYFLDGAEERGLTYEAVRAFEDAINKQFDRGHLRVFCVILPVHRDQLVPALLEGYGDIIAANLTVTPGREERVDFSIPWMQDIDELLVTGPAAPPLRSLADLAGASLHVRRSSSYWQSVERLNERLHTQGREPVRRIPAPESLEDEDLLEMVNAGLLPMVVVDSHKARFWQQIFDKTEVRDDLALRTGGTIAWAFRRDSPQLAEVVNGFVRKHREGTLFGNVVLQRYLEETSWVRNALEGPDVARFEETIEHFRTYADRYGFEYLMLAAQGYQESRLDQRQRSAAGAVGVMQLLPSTAADPNVGVSDIEKLENNIHAGVKYLDFIRSRYFNDPAIAEEDRVLLSFAAYNAGPARVRRLRQKTAELGLDPDIWFDNVEVAAARDIGRETVQYVANICKYYLAYQLLTRRMAERERTRDTLSPP